MNMLPLGSKTSEFDYRSAARAILPRLAATADNSEKMRRLDDDAAAALRESGLTRVLTPRKFGGFELSPSGHIWACAELGQVCSSASWVLMVCVAHDYIVGRFPDQCQKEVYEGDSNNLLAGCLQPQGMVESVPQGWRLDGRWQFGSGCDHSPWFILGAKATNPKADDYLIYHVMVPRAEVELDDTWHTLGMQAPAQRILWSVMPSSPSTASCLPFRRSSA
ncbi:3-hydroxy-9,10-secoandrosta-1,3,5(10)-triene-9,17-dione monooxygenase [Bradyrhizobium sp. Rc3b]|uniref:acyl-CoA dehydrogenase family protein n=1 Tax=Bradyrhizobium sp. Rc3b TaxID=1855322 RepID=UPI0008F0413B|nr:acyl-CoA dehydrogenase family protein [Bradyrhizobium sp. Rc3b]SFM49471.1 3-hydroxy-9,10-secoandrosta-1,3,5(10)-triene-9,17-dione monooxygenase [Bradyrhizobium sp. Rc3b]